MIPSYSGRTRALVLLKPAHITKGRISITKSAWSMNAFLINLHKQISHLFVKFLPHFWHITNWFWTHWEKKPAKHTKSIKKSAKIVVFGKSIIRLGSPNISWTNVMFFKNHRDHIQEILTVGAVASLSSNPYE